MDMDHTIDIPFTSVVYSGHCIYMGTECSNDLWYCCDIVLNVIIILQTGDIWMNENCTIQYVCVNGRLTEKPFACLESEDCEGGTCGPGKSSG